jgi:membrane-associated protease RseP (regulator of RpoE activity)
MGVFGKVVRNGFVAGIFAAVRLLGADATGAAAAPTAKDTVVMDPFRVIAEDVVIDAYYKTTWEKTQKTPVRQIRLMKVYDVKKNSAAEKAGLKAGMTILKINGVAVLFQTNESFTREFSQRENPTAVTFSVKTLFGSKEISVPLSAADRKAAAGAASAN